MTEQKFKISVVGCSCFEVGGSYDQCDILPPMGSKPIVEPTSIHRIFDPSNKLPPSEASLSLIRESRHLVLVLPTNGLDTCINRLLIMNRPSLNIIIINLVLIVSSPGLRARRWRTTYSTLKFWPPLQLAPRSSLSLQTSRYSHSGTNILTAGAKIIPVTTGIQISLHWHQLNFLHFDTVAEC